MHTPMPETVETATRVHGTLEAKEIHKPKAQADHELEALSDSAPPRIVEIQIAQPMNSVRCRSIASKCLEVL